MDTSGGITNSVGEHLRTVLQTIEPRSNNSTASQPSGIQDNTATQALVHPRLFSNIIDAEMSSPEEGEILQQISPAQQTNIELPASQITQASTTPTNMATPFSAANQSTNNYYYIRNINSNNISINSPQAFTPNETDNLSTINVHNASNDAQLNRSPIMASQKESPNITANHNHSTY